ncbi:hypothetical protein OROMI_002768 [Orobanche minor]
MPLRFSILPSYDFQGPNGAAAGVGAQHSQVWRCTCFRLEPEAVFLCSTYWAAEAIIKDSVEPLLEEYRPPGITSLKFSKLSLGTVAPKIEGKMTLEIIQYLLSAQSPDAKFRNEAESTPELQEETILVGGLLSILQLSMGKATVGDASNCRNKPDKASVFMLQADCWKITLLGDEFRDGSLRRRLKNVEIPKEDLKNLEVGDFDCCC